MEPRRNDLLDQKTVEKFMDRWMNDPAFAGLLRADPKTALASCGIEPDPEMIAFFGNLKQDASVEELRARVSKGRRP